MKSSARILLISVLLLALIFVPMLSGGYAELSRAQSAAGLLDQSVHYQLAAERLPWRTDLYELAGQAAFNAHEYQRAIGLFQTAGQKAALSETGRLELGQAFLAAGQQDEAIAEWKNLLSDNRVRGSASQLLADVYHTRAQFDDEQHVLQQWLMFEPGNLDAQYRLGLLLFAQASPDALPPLGAVAGGGPAELKAPVAGLISTLKTALGQPARSERLLTCGRTLAAIGEWPLAGQAFLNATQADSSDGLAWAWLGEARLQIGGDAAGAFGRALAVSPDSAEIHAMAALYWQRQRNWKKALAEFSTAARLDPQNAVWQMSLGDTYTHLGDMVKALANYQAAISLAPGDPQTWRALALFSVENGIDIEGIGRNSALRAYALQPDDMQNLDTLGRALMATAQWDPAEVFFKRAIDAGPDQAAPRFHLGLLYLQTNRPDLARQYLQSAQTLDPGGPIGTQAAAVLSRYLP